MLLCIGDDLGGGGDRHQQVHLVEVVADELVVLPEVQQTRTLASALKVRFRAEVAERRFGDALRTAKTLFALSRHLGEHPTLIADLVGIGVAFLAIGPVEEMIQQPGCPNLYWALTDLPRPLVSVRKGMQSERMLLATSLPLLVGNAPLSKEQVHDLIEQTARLLKDADSTPEGGLKGWLEKRVKDEGHVRAARKRLVEAGLPEARVKRFPAVQVVLLDEKREYDESRDEGLKWVGLPYWQVTVPVGLMRAEEAGSLFVPLISPALEVRQAQARLEQRFALLRHVEALRLYAAGHGKWPARLADV